MLKEVVMGKNYRLVKLPSQIVTAVAYHFEDGVLYFVNLLDRYGDCTFNYIAVERMALQEMEDSLC